MTGCILLTLHSSGFKRTSSSWNISIESLVTITRPLVKVKSSTAANWHGGYRNLKLPLQKWLVQYYSLCTLQGRRRWEPFSNELGHSLMLIVSRSLLSCWQFVFPWEQIFIVGFALETTVVEVVGSILLTLHPSGRNESIPIPTGSFLITSWQMKNHFWPSWQQIQPE